MLEITYKWQPGTITKKSSALSFKVKLPSGRLCRCHQEQLRKREISPSELNQLNNNLIRPLRTLNLHIPLYCRMITLDTAVKLYPQRVRNPVQSYEPKRT